jgi:hypothetical protein
MNIINTDENAEKCLGLTVEYTSIDELYDQQNLETQNYLNGNIQIEDLDLIEDVCQYHEESTTDIKDPHFLAFLDFLDECAGLPSELEDGAFETYLVTRGANVPTLRIVG